MDLKLRPASSNDVEALCQTFFSGFADEPVTRHSFPSTSESAWDFWRKAMADDLQEPNIHFVIVDDVSATPPTIVAFAKWRGVAAGTDLPAPPSLNEWPRDGDQELAASFFGDAWRRQKQIMGGRPHWYLELLSTKKEYQRKGIGRILLKWGLDKADTDGWECYLGSTPEGKGLYEKYGFKEVEGIDSFTYWDGVVLQTYMRRDRQEQ